MPVKNIERKQISIHTSTKQALDRLKVTLTPVVNRPCTVDDVINTAEEIIRQHLGLPPIPEENLEDVPAPVGLAS